MYTKIIRHFQSGDDDRVHFNLEILIYIILYLVELETKKTELK
jgi:hypothetical protein